MYDCLSKMKDGTALQLATKLVQASQHRVPRTSQRAFGNLNVLNNQRQSTKYGKPDYSVRCTSISIIFVASGKYNEHFLRCKYFEGRGEGRITVTVKNRRWP